MPIEMKMETETGRRGLRTLDGVKTDHVLSNARSLEAVCKCGSATVSVCEFIMNRSNHKVCALWVNRNYS